MSVELERDLRTYMSYLDAVLPTISADDIVEPGPALAPVPPPRRRGWLIAAAAAAVVLSVGLLVVLGSRLGGGPAPVITEPSPDVTEPAPEPTAPDVTEPSPASTVPESTDDRGVSPTHTIAQPGGWVAGLAIYEDTLWALVQVPGADTSSVADEMILAQGQILRIDLDTGNVLSRIDIGEALLWEPAIEAGEGAVWVAWGNLLVRVDPTNETVETVVDTLVTGQDDPLGNDVHGRLAVGEGAVWLLDDESSLMRIDPITNAVTATLELGGDPLSVEVGAGSVWVLVQDGPIDPVTNTVPEAGLVLRIDPRTLEVTPTVRISDMLLPGSGRPLAFGEGALWVTNVGAVTRIDPDTNSIVASIPVPGSGCGPLAIGFGGGKVWTATSGAWLASIDPRTNTASTAVWVREPVGGGGPVFNIAGTDDALWITRMASLLQRVSTADITSGVTAAPTPCT